LDERSWGWSRNSSLLRSLSSLKGGSVTLLDYWFPCAESNSEGDDGAFCPRGEWNLKQPLEGGSDSRCVLIIEHRCLANCLVVPSLPASVVVSSCQSSFHTFQRLGHCCSQVVSIWVIQNLSCPLLVVGGGARCQLCLIGLLVLDRVAKFWVGWDMRCMGAI
jgi:hypothetical protein